jgi:hypothetical protein
MRYYIITGASRGIGAGQRDLCPGTARAAGFIGRTREFRGRKVVANISSGAAQRAYFGWGRNVHPGLRARAAAGGLAGSGICDRTGDVLDIRDRVK